MTGKIAAIIPVAGIGKRFGGNQPKQYLALGSHSVLGHTLINFLNIQEINPIVVVTSPGEIKRSKDLIEKEAINPDRIKFAEGGKERQDSVANGLHCLPEDTEIIIVHDGVRPFIKSDIIRRSIETARQKGACIAAVPVKDTIKEVTGDRVIRTIPRDTLYQVQTPQTFKYEILVSAHRLAAEKNYYSTDESSLVEWAGYPVTVVNGSYENIKITTREDYFMAVQILERMS